MQPPYHHQTLDFSKHNCGLELIKNKNTMSACRILIEFEARDAAHRAAAVLEQLYEPTPDAVTIFKAGETATALESDDAGWQIEAYFQSNLSAEPIDEDALCADVAQTLGVPAHDVQIAPVPDKNWVALSQAALPPVRAGRFTIFGSHDRNRIARGPHAILIDAGEAFGTAHHATTYGCLLAIDDLARRHVISSALDLGCGSAVLAIALARSQPEAHILASDSDRQSIVVACQNIQTNRVNRQVDALVANGLDHPRLRRAQPFDVVIANILAGPLFDLAPIISPAVVSGGQLILSGILDPQAREIEARYRAFGFAIAQKRCINGWTTLTLFKATA